MQDDNLVGDVSSMDLATEENLKNLVKVGEDLLKKPVTTVNLETGHLEPYENYHGTNQEALIRSFICLSLSTLPYILIELKSFF